MQHHYGELILDYYRSGLTDLGVFHFENLYLYGGLFDIVAVALAKILPLDAYDLRHIMCALIGIGGIGATAATARLIATPRAGFLAGTALALCGAWYGGMFNHTKDISLGPPPWLARCIFWCGCRATCRDRGRPTCWRLACWPGRRSGFASWRCCW